MCVINQRDRAGPGRLTCEPRLLDQVRGKHALSKSACLEPKVRADGIGDLEAAIQVWMAHDQVAVGKQRLLPVSARRADRQQGSRRGG